MVGFFRKRRVAKLWEKGRALLEEEEYEGALEVARQLERDRYSGAFDLAAQAHAGLGRLSDAIATLERGVAAAPGAWLNWELLGNYRSDAGKFEDAAAAYQQALLCENVWVDSVHLNQAVLAQRRGLTEDALQTVDLIQDPALALQKLAVKADLLLEAGKPDAAIEQCKASPCPADPTPEQRRRLSGLCVTHGKALLALGERPEVVRDLIREAVDKYPESEDLLSLLRQVQNESSAHARVFRVVVTYALDAATAKKGGPVGYLRSGLVVADSPEEAVARLRELEGGPALAFDDEPEIELLDEEPGPLKGVLRFMGRIYYNSRE